MTQPVQARRRRAIPFGGGDLVVSAPDVAGIVGDGSTDGAENRLEALWEGEHTR